MAIPCNFTPAEQTEALERFGGRNRDELEEAREHFTQYIFFETWGRKDFREYFCPVCGSFEVERDRDLDIYQEDPFRFHHGDNANCPCCGREGRLICLGKMRSFGSLREKKNLCFMRAVNGELYLSAGIGEVEYSVDDLCPLPQFTARARYVVKPGKRQMWRALWYGEPQGNWMRMERKWEAKKTFVEPFARTHWYGGTLMSGEVSFVGAGEVEKTSMRYCGLLDFALIRWGVDLQNSDGVPHAPVRGVLRYLGEYSRRPQLEMLVKLGHEDAVEALLDDDLPRETVNWRARTPAAFFGLTKPEYRIFCECGGRLKSLRDWKQDEPGMGFEEYMRMSEYLKGETKAFTELCRRLGVGPERGVAYIMEQAPLGDDGRKTFGLWRDYIDACTALERDLRDRRVIMPEELRAEHDAATALRQCAADKADAKLYGKRFRALKRKYAYSDGKMCIVVPTGEEDVVREGKHLQHCVGGYAKRHVQGKTTILFLREKATPMTPYATIEINDETLAIRQVHGFRNEATGMKNPRDENRDFVAEWEKWLAQGSPRTKNGKPVRPRTGKKKVEVAV